MSSGKHVILIIEDNEMSLTMVRYLLEVNGYTVLEARDGEAGVQMVKGCQPDLVLMDLQLPVKSGYEAISELRADAAFSSLPIVAFTASAMDEEHERAMAHGCTGFITKPIDIHQFVETVEGYLNRNASHTLQ